jgi:RNA polymerase sigma factor (sigma-70 family)
VYSKQEKLTEKKAMNEDNKLIQAALSGDSRSFDRLVEKYQSMICAITFSATGRLETSEELAQETFFRAWKNLAQLKEIEKFRFWLCSIARNLIHTYYHQKHADKVSVCDDDTLETLASQHIQSPADTLISQEEEMILSEALMQIPEEYREPLVLYYRQQQSTKEVAESLDLNEATVRTRLSRGRQMLKDQVSAMVEKTLAKSGPTKKFTKTVMVAIGTGLAAGTAATAGMAAKGANTGTAAGGVSAILTGIGTKVTAIVAAVLLIGSGVLVYSYWNSSNHSSTSEQVVHTEPVSVQSVTEKADSTSAEKAQVASKPVEPPQANPPANLSPNSTEKEPASLSQDATTAKSGTGISGIVLDKSTSKPIKDAEIFYGKDRSSSVFSDPNGHFELLGMKSNPRQQFYVIAKHYATRTIVLEIIKDKIYQNFKVELIPGSTVTGVVSDPNGNPIEGVTVKTFHFTNHPVLTDKDGQFEIDGLDPAFGQCQLEAVHPNYPAVNTEFSPASAGQAVVVDFILKPGITVYGKITNTQGQPLSNVSVGNTTSRSMWNCIQTKTDQEGQYTLKNIPEGNFVIWAVSKQYAPYVEHTVLDSSQSTKLINIQLADPCPIHGKIVDAQGNPVPKINISLREYKGVSNLGRDRVTSDSEGKFTILNGPREGQMILEAFGETIPNTMPQLEAGQEQEYIITVERSGRIYGKVLDDRTGEPVRKFNVKLGRTSKGNAGYGYSATWDRQGHTFESSQGFFDTGIETIPVGGQYAVIITAENFNPLTIDPVIVQPTSTDPNRTEFRLKTATVITGRVVDCNSMPIAKAAIRRLTEENNMADLEEHWDPSDTATTDSKGEFTLSGVSSGNNGLYITASTFAPYIGVLTNLPRNSQGTVEIKLNPGASIFGRIMDPNDQGKSGSQVSVFLNMEQLQQISGSSWYSMRTAADADGYYEITDLPAGTFSVTVNPAKGGNTFASKRITLKAGQSQELNFGDEPGFTVKGTVRKGQTLLAEADITITFPDKSSKTARSDGTGHFVIHGVPAGDYAIEARYNASGQLGLPRWDPKSELRETIQVKIKEHTTIDISFGDGSIKGKIPVQYRNYENLRLLAGRCQNRETDTGLFSDTSRIVEAKIDSEGNYDYDNLSSGQYYLQLDSAGQTLAISDAFELGESQHLENISLKSGSGILRIQFVDAQTGQVIPNAHFRLQNEYGANFYLKKLTDKNNRIVTNSEGMNDFTELPAGKYTVRSLAPGYLMCQSDFFQVNNDNITPAKIDLTAACIIQFELSNQIKSKITSKTAYLICQVTNLSTQTLVPVEDIYFYGLEEHLVWLINPDDTAKLNSSLNLPPGQYKIRYSLYQDQGNFSSYKDHTPLFTGSFQVDLAKRDTKTLTIAQDQ